MFRPNIFQYDNNPLEIDCALLTYYVGHCRLYKLRSKYAYIHTFSYYQCSPVYQQTSFPLTIAIMKC